MGNRNKRKLLTGVGQRTKGELQKQREPLSDVSASMFLPASGLGSAPLPAQPPVRNGSGSRPICVNLRNLWLNSFGCGSAALCSFAFFRGDSPLKSVVFYIPCVKQNILLINTS